jgi:SAM-dependent methyltransferase
LNSSLDLYAKIEPLIGFYDEYEELYSSYLQLLFPLHVNSVLDIGCGNGKLLKLLEENGFDAFGIDRSKEMIKRACKLGVKAEVKELSSLDKNSYECALAVGDVLNYIKDNDLDGFFDDVRKVVGDGGYFLADINTQIGFEVADGVMVKDFDDKFLSIEANYDDEILTTDITLFEKKEKEYEKLSAQILQYFHRKERFENLKNFRLVGSSAISMFSDDDEKLLMLFQAI